MKRDVGSSVYLMMDSTCCIYCGKNTTPQKKEHQNKKRHDEKKIIKSIYV